MTNSNNENFVHNKTVMTKDGVDIMIQPLRRILYYNHADVFKVFQYTEVFPITITPSGTIRVHKMAITQIPAYTLDYMDKRASGFVYVDPTLFREINVKTMNLDEYSIVFFCKAIVRMVTDQFGISHSMCYDGFLVKSNEILRTV